MDRQTLDRLHFLDTNLNVNLLEIHVGDELKDCYGANELGDRSGRSLKDMIDICS